jgi:nucleoside-diphosphate-sugar epimerase
MRVFVSGATGVVGKRVIPLLVSQGYAVTALVRNPAGSKRPELAGATCVVADLFDLASLTRAIVGHDAIVNLATHMPSSSFKMLFRSSWRENDRIRTEGVANLVDAALVCEVPTFVQESFAPTYPDRGDEWIDERTALEPSDYNKTVLDAERSVARFRDSKRRGVILRFAAFYGPDAMQVKTIIDALRKGWAALPGGPDRFISSISHDDAATAVVAALNAPSGAYNIVDDEPVRRAVYFGTLAQQLGLKPPRFLPEWITPLLGSVGEAMARSLRLSNSKLKSATPWAPRFSSVYEGWPTMLGQMNQA